MIKKYFWGLFFGVIFLSFVFGPKQAEAFLGFGGRILSVTPCDEGMLISIGPPRPGLFMLMPGSLTFSWYQIKKGPWALGAYVPGGICTILGIPVALVSGTITIIGTSFLTFTFGGGATGGGGAGGGF